MIHSAGRRVCATMLSSVKRRWVSSSRAGVITTKVGFGGAISSVVVRERNGQRALQIMSDPRLAALAQALFVEMFGSLQALLEGKEFPYALAGVHGETGGKPGILEKQAGLVREIVSGSRIGQEAAEAVFDHLRAGRIAGENHRNAGAHGFQ